MAALKFSIVGLITLGRLCKYEQKGSKFLIFITIVIITITPIIIILSSVMQAAQHPQKVALSLKTPFCNAHVCGLSSEHVTLAHASIGHTMADAVQTQNARRVNRSFI
jgi:hypothetical protein